MLRLPNGVAIRSEEFSYDDYDEAGEKEFFTKRYTLAGLNLWGFYRLRCVLFEMCVCVVCVYPMQGASRCVRCGVHHSMATRDG